MNWRTAPKEPPVTIIGDIIRETGAAILFKVASSEGISESIWFPLSTVRSIHRSPNMGEDSLVVEHWIATKKGLV